MKNQLHTDSETADCGQIAGTRKGVRAIEEQQFLICIRNG
jgi:hypothetical protein